MSCYSCGGNPNTFCGECVNNRDTWITPVDVLPDVFMGDFDHLFRTPDGNLYALSPDRTEWIQVNGTGGKATKYTAGNGIEISDRNVITNTQPNVNQNLSIDGRTITISNGNSITLPEDRGTVYNDTELKKRVQAIENKTDNFVSGVSVSREGNKVKLTYTFVNGAPKEVEFEDKDTVTLAYDDTALKARVNALENKEDKDTKYTAKGNGLILNTDNSFQLDIATNITYNCPYSTNGSGSSLIRIAPELRYSGQLQDSISYAVDNDGTEQKGVFIEAGILFDYEGRTEYEGTTTINLSGANYKFKTVTTLSPNISGTLLAVLHSSVKLEIDMVSFWKDANNKVSFSFKPKVIWGVKLDSSMVYYEHYITREELDSSEPIEIEVKKGETLIGKLQLTLSNIRVYIQNPQERIVLKNPSDNKYYYVSRLN